MRIPFSQALKVGTDIICRSRIAAFHVSGPTKIQKFARRLLQHQELVDLNTRFPDWHNPSPSATNSQERAITWLAGRWAAKEAAKKAWGASILSFRDLHVEVQRDGEVVVICAPETTNASVKIEQVAKLSISHDADYATAVVIAEPLDERIKAKLGQRKAEAEIEAGDK